jgi:ketosteroid isomerase-like protein
VSEHEVRRLRSVYDAFDRGDEAALLEALAHDIEWRVPDVLPWGGVRHGHEGVRSFFTILEEHVEGGWGSPEEFLDMDERIVVLGRFSGSVRDNGVEFETRFAHVWTIRDGVASGFDNYLDTATVVAALEGRTLPKPL